MPGDTFKVHLRLFASAIIDAFAPNFRHYFATHLLEAHYDIRTVQELLGHKARP